jgi:hypothetical protein
MMHWTQVAGVVGITLIGCGVLVAVAAIGREWGWVGALWRLLAAFAIVFIAIGLLALAMMCVAGEFAPKPAPPAEQEAV